MNFCLLYFLPLSEKILTVLSCYSPSLHCNFISIFGHYLHLNHSQHDFHKPLLQVLLQRTSLQFLSKIHFKAVLDGVDFKIFSFFSFFRQTFLSSLKLCPLWNFDLRTALPLPVFIWDCPWILIWVKEPLGVNNFN